MSNTVYETMVKELKASTEDIRPSDIVLFSEPLRSVLNFVNRLGRFSLTEFNEKLEFKREEAKKIADILVERNLFEVSKFSNDEETFYVSRVSALTRPMNRPPSGIWKKID
jgi:predicted transcriptional regulator